MSEELLLLNKEREWIHENCWWHEEMKLLMFSIGSWQTDHETENSLVEKGLIIPIPRRGLRKYKLTVDEFDKGRKYYLANPRIMEQFDLIRGTGILYIRELPDMLGSSLNQEEIELLNDCLNNSWVSFPLFEGLGVEDKLKPLVEDGVLELYHEKERTYKATGLWRDYVRLILVNW